jgi:glycosyltransferase involved in cell wall biosynthesis
LENAELLSWSAWRMHPGRSLLRIVPLAVKEHVNRLAGRPIFDLSFYLKFQPSALVIRDTIVQPLTYIPRLCERRRIALITPHLGPGGAEAALLDIALALTAEAFDVSVLATQSTNRAWLLRWRAVARHVYDLAAAIPAEKMVETLVTMTHNWRWDSILIQNSLAAYAALPHLRSASPATRIFDLVHAIDDKWDQLAVTASSAGQIDARIAATSAVRERLREVGTPAERIRLIPNGVDLDRFSPGASQAGDSAHRILFAGRLDPVKRPWVLADIAARLAASRPDLTFRMVVVGEGPEAGALHEAIGRNGVDPLFELQSYVNDIASVIRESDICILPSRAEGVPLFVLEAMACAKPVVASNVGAIAEAVDASCGILIDRKGDEASAFAAAIGRLLSDQSLRKRMGAAGRARVEAQFDSRHARQAYVELFSK